MATKKNPSQLLNSFQTDQEQQITAISNAGAISNPLIQEQKKREEQERNAEEVKKHLEQQAKREEQASAPATEEKRKVGRPKTAAPSEMIGFYAYPEDKKEWQQFFKSYDFTLSQGIRKAVNYFIEQVKEGNIKL